VALIAALLAFAELAVALMIFAISSRRVKTKPAIVQQRAGNWVPEELETDAGKEPRR
jgi:hypothetical protein